MSCEQNDIKFENNHNKKYVLVINWWHCRRLFVRQLSLARQ